MLLVRSTVPGKAQEAKEVVESFNTLSQMVEVSFFCVSVRVHGFNEM